MIKFLKHYPEVLTIPVAVLIFIVSVPLLRIIDPTAGVFDAGIFQIPIFAIIVFLMFVSVAWFVFRLIYGTLGRYLKKQFKLDFKIFTPWQKAKLSFSVFFCLLFVLAYLAKTLVTG